MSESTPGHGRKVRGRAGERPRASPPGLAATRQPIRVLVVDDTRANLDLVRAAFDGRGWQFVTASDGEEGLALAVAQLPDVVVSDILMPTMDGFELVRRLREAGLDIPVIFYTATYHEREASVLAAAAGVTRVVYKDGSIGQLVEAVDAVLRTRDKPRPVRAARGDFDALHVRLLTSRLADRTRRLEIANLRQSALLRVAAALASERDTARMASIACHSARDLTGSAITVLTVYGQDGAVRHAAIAGRPAGAIAPLIADPGVAALLRRPCETGQVVRIEGDGRPAEPTGDGAISVAGMVGVPVRSETHVYGALWSTPTIAGEPLDDVAVDLLTALARQVAVGLENDRLAGEVQSGINLLQAVVNGSEEAVFVKDRAGRYLLVNEKAAALIGRPAAEIVGRADEELGLASEPEGRRAIERAIMLTGSPHIAEELIDGGPVPRTYLSNRMALRHARGDVSGLIGYSVDITDQKALDNRLRHSQKLEALGRLASGTAHDFNNILTAITGFTELLLGASGPIETHREDLAAIRDASERGSALTRQLLIFGRQQVVRARVVDINEAVHAVVRLARPLIGEDVVVDLRLAAGTMPVLMDPLELEQVVLNLVLNARDAMPGGGTISIETARRRGRQATLTVRDRGCGMSPETQARIFEPFFTTKPIGHGSGLGLAVLHGIVSEARGSVSVESRVGVGSTFIVTLPLLKAPTDAVPPAAPSITTTPPAVPGRLLVVEDEPLVRDFIAGALRRDHYDVVVAQGVAEGVAAVTAAGPSFDLLLCDMILADGRGPTVAEAARAVVPGLPIIFMSGYVEKEVFDSPIVAGCAFLAKPFGADQLRTAVRAAVDGSSRDD